MIEAKTQEIRHMGSLCWEDAPVMLWGMKLAFYPEKSEAQIPGEKKVRLTLDEKVLLDRLYTDPGERIKLDDDVAATSLLEKLGNPETLFDIDPDGWIRLAGGMRDMEPRYPVPNQA